MPLIAVAVDSNVKRLKEKLNMKCRNDLLRESVAEFLGTFLLTLIGNAAVALVVLSEMGTSGKIAGPLGWGLALMIAIAVTGGVSGCHANPAVTLAMASVGKLPWRKVGAYMFSQYFGGFVSSVVVYAVYYDKISHFDGGSRMIPPNASATAQIFSTYAPDEVTILTTMGDQLVATAILLLVICAVTDPVNMNIPKGLYPITLGLSLCGIIMCFQINCAAPLNPARDLAPRAFTALAGWGKEVFSFRAYTYFWVPVVGPHLGALIGAWLYKLMIEQHWPVDSYDFGSPTEVKTNGEFKKKDDLPFVDKKNEKRTEERKSEE